MFHAKFNKEFDFEVKIVIYMNDSRIATIRTTKRISLTEQKSKKFI